MIAIYMHGYPCYNFYFWLFHFSSRIQGFCHGIDLEIREAHKDTRFELHTMIKFSYVIRGR